MARPSTTGDKTGAAKRHKTQRRIASAAIRSKNSSGSGLSKELKEAREQQAATAEILKVIASSPHDVQPVFEAIVGSAAKLFEPCAATITMLKDGKLHWSATEALLPGYDVEGTKTIYPIAFDPERSPSARAILERRIIEIPDIGAADTPEYTRKAAAAGGFRAITYVPLIEQNQGIGTIIFAHPEPGFKFTEKQLAMVQTFADQAVIAIGNARLFNEVKATTADLEESLQQQTATSEVLQVISSSPGDLAPVFEKMLENATRVCGAEFGSMVLIEDGDTMRSAALYNAPPELVAARANWTFKIHPQSSIGRAFREKRVIQTEDLRQAATYLEGNRSSVELAELGGARTIVVVPMLRDDEVIGMITVYRQEVRLFDDKQIELLRNFARQAVIAIENARLLRELRQRTGDLTEALTYQTGSASILNVIASSPTDVAPVLKAIVESACKLCEAYDAVALLKEGNYLLFGAHHGPIPIEMGSLPISRNWTPGLAVMEQKPVHIHDLLSSEGDQVPEAQRRAREFGYRTILSVPMLRGNESVGVLALRRSEAHPFSDKQIALLQTFADQAVIAIGNVRLFEEVQQRTRDLSEALQQQTATADVLKVISSSPGELKPVFQALLENAVRLCEAEFGMLFLPEENEFRAVGKWNLPLAYSEFLGKNTIRADPRIPLSRAAMTKQPVQVADILVDQSYIVRHPGIVAVAEDGGARTLLQVPMLKENELVGTIGIYRQEVRPFSDKQITLVQNFAAQAVIAIENASLLSELRERTDDLTRSLDDLRTAQDRLIQTEKLASLGQLTAGIAHEIKNPLNFVNNFSALSAELVGEMNDVLAGATLDKKTRGDLDELAQTLKSNLEKVVQHGKRADSIVKNMLQHSREGSGEHRPTDINAIVDESLNLAYHGARAEKAGFSIALQRDLDPSVGMADIYPQEITRVLLNLISNGFYATTKRSAEVGEGFEPMLSAATKNLGDKIEIRIRDNGTGIPDEVKEKIFHPFFTTKPSGEGTGLGLSMSHDIIVKQHGGSIDVETEPGLFTEFKIVLPRTSQR